MSRAPGTLSLSSSWYVSKSVDLVISSAKGVPPEPSTDRRILRAASTQN